MGKFTIEKDIAQHIKKTVGPLLVRLYNASAVLTTISSTSAKALHGTA